MSVVPFPSGAGPKPSIVVGRRVAPDTEGVVRRIWNQAVARPDRVAISFEDRTLTYGDLESASNDLVETLGSLGLQPATIVPVVVDKGWEYPVLVLGLWKAGFAVAPVDPEYPIERIRGMVRACGSPFAILQSTVRNSLLQGWADSPLVHTLLVRSDASLVEAPPAAPVWKPRWDSGTAPVAPSVNELSVSYMIFTSGTSGEPKGVLVQHRSLSSLARYYESQWNLGVDDVVSQLTSFSFDASMGEIFPALAAGARVEIFPSLKKVPPEDILAALVERNVTFTTFSPTALKLFLPLVGPLGKDPWKSLRVMLCGGEALPYHLVHEFCRIWERRARLVNIYGPTEATVFSTVHEPEVADGSGEAIVPVGGPIDNEAIVILNGLTVCAVGEPGEIAIGGAGLAIGYHQDPQKTDAAFVTLPNHPELGRLYRTGDRGLLDPDGQVRFLGRLTDQVKIRGHRVEIGEVETTLKACDNVKDALVLSHLDDQGQLSLVAYFIGLTPAIDAASVREFLETRLPDYMIPTFWIPLESFPMTTHGKVDRKRLPAPAASRSQGSEAVEGLETPAERDVGLVWCEVLRIPRVRRRDHFKYLGGDSIAALKAVSLLRSKGYDLRPQQLSEHPVLCDLAAHLAPRVSNQVMAVPPVVSGVFPLTPIQEWFFAMNLGNPDFHHQSMEFLVPASLDAKTFRRVFGKLARTHEALRTEFFEGPQGWQQRILPRAVPLVPAEHDLRGLDEAEQKEKLRAIGSEVKRSIQIRRGPLMAAALVRVTEESTRLIWGSHHLIVDTVSWYLLIEDFQRHWQEPGRGAPGSEPRLPYGIWSQAVRERYAAQPHRDEIVQELERWKPLVEARASLQLPRIGHPHGSTADRARVQRFTLDPQETAQLTGDCLRCYGTTVEEMLLVGLFRSVGSWTGSHRVAIDVEWHGRDSEWPGLDPSRTVGWFTSIRPILFEGRPSEDLQTSLIRVKEQRRNEPSSGLGFNRLRWLSNHPEVRRCFEAYCDPELVFNYSGQVLESMGTWRTMPPSSSDNEGTNANPYLMSIEAGIAAGELNIDLWYSDGVVDAQAVSALGSLFHQELRALIEHCSDSSHTQRTPSDFPGTRLSVDQAKAIPNSVVELLPLSDLQRAMVFFRALNPESPMYEVQVVYRFDGPFQEAAFAQAVDHLMDRHDVLRSRLIDEVTVDPWLGIERTCEVPIRVQNLQGRSKQEVALIEESLLREQRNLRFDLSTAPLLSLQVLDLSSEFHILLKIHHLIHDGWSLSLLMNELETSYRALCAGRRSPALPAPARFRDYVEYQSRTRDDPSLRTFWREQFQEFELVRLPCDPEEPNSVSQIYSCSVPSSLSLRIRSSQTEYGTTLNSLLLGGLSILHNALSGATDLTFGIVTSGRGVDLENYDTMVGCCVNTLPLRLRLAGNPRLLDVALQVDRTMARIGENPAFPLSEILQLARSAHATRPFELFDCLYNFESYGNVGPGQGPTMVTGFEMTNYPLSFGVSDMDDLTVNVTYAPALFRRSTIERWSELYLRILEAMVQNPVARLSELELLGPAERRFLSVELNPAPVSYDSAKGLYLLFQETAQTQPDAVALTFGTRSLTYRQLLQRTDTLGSLLRTRGVEPGTLVGILVDRSLELVIGILAILRAGGAYVPLDPDYPEERVRYMIGDSEAPLVLLSERTRRVDLGPTVKTLKIDDPSVYEGPVEPGPDVPSTSLAYVIYTSGSTGLPKGVMIEQRSVHNFVRAMADVIPFHPNQKILSVTTVSFDIFGLETLTSILLGQGVHMASAAEQRDPELLAAAIVDHGITMLQTTPSRYQMLLASPSGPRALSRLNYLLVGGEALSFELAQKLKASSGGRVLNLYGPTETTIWSTAGEVIAGARPTIGKPVRNTSISIVDSLGRLCPLGVAGELCIGGEGLARGYWRRPELTEEKFRPHPDDPSVRIYHTGDLARWMPDGTLDFLGRMDLQIKIRGYRVELGEIESALLGFDEVEEAAVVAKSLGEAEPSLVAYYTGSEPEDPTLFRKRLQESLPEYMVPTLCCHLDRMPKTPNGKLDRKALMAVIDEAPTSSESTAKPTNPDEHFLAAIWASVLGRPEVGIDEDFFGLGGHSLSLMQVVGRVRDQKGIVLSVSEFFETPTIRQLARRLRDCQETAPAPWPSLSLEREFDLTPSQRALFALDQRMGPNTRYNLPGVFRGTGLLDERRLVSAIEGLVARHEALRTSFRFDDGRFLQTVVASPDFELQRYDLGASTGTWQEAFSAFLRPFALDQAPLFRAAVAQASGQPWYLFFDVHHLVADGRSLELLLSDLCALYEGQDLPSPRFQFRHFAAWQKTLWAEEQGAGQRRFWLDRFSAGVSSLGLPTDYPRPVVPSGTGARALFPLETDRSERLLSLARTKGFTPFVFFLSAFAVFLAKYADQRQVVVGTPVSGRRRDEARDIVGMLVNTLALPLAVDPDQTLDGVVQATQQLVLEALEHQDFPFETLVEELGVLKDRSRNPLFDTMFVYQDGPVNPGLQGQTLEPVRDFAWEIAKFDLTLSVEAGPSGLLVQWEYSTDLFGPSTIARFQAAFDLVLTAFEQRWDASVGSLSLLAVADAQRIATAFHQGPVDPVPEGHLVEVFARQAARTPDAIAVVSGDTSISYSTLDEISDRIAGHLFSVGQGPNGVVALLLPRGQWMIPAILGVLKAGCAYLPVDPDTPMDRQRSALHAAGAQHFLSVSGVESTHDGTSRWNLDRLALDSVPWQPIPIASVAPAYMLFTSGSSGTPKGVVVSHRNVLNLLGYLRREMYRPGQRISQTAGYHFDASVMEIFGALGTGGTLFLMPPVKELSVDGILGFLAKNQIHHFLISPSYLKQLLPSVPGYLADLQELESITVGGEALEKGTYLKARETFGPKLLFRTVYGPTETTVFSTALVLDGAEEEGVTISLGRPIDNTEIRIVDQAGALRPLGAPGEIVIAGDGVALGYLGVRDQGDRRFRGDPVRPGVTLYHTGDVGSWTEDGRILFGGRQDTQVKIHGLRVELGEIQVHLKQVADVSDVLVSLRPLEDFVQESVLCGYYVASREVDPHEFVQALEAKLAPALHPVRYWRMEAIPLTANGKVDVKALPSPRRSEVQDGDTTPSRHDLDRALLQLWGRVLGVPPGGIRSDFFSLGGDSLKAIALSADIRRTLGLDVTVPELFTLTTIEAQSDQWSQRAHAVDRPVVPVPGPGPYPTTFGQSRLFALDQMMGISKAYCIPLILAWDGPLDRDRLDAALAWVVERHETLRTEFRLVDDRPVQVVQPSLSIVMESLQGEAATAIAAFLDRTNGFDLGAAPLFRAGLVMAGPDRHVLCLEFHHLLLDAQSVQVLLGELKNAYESLPSEPLTIQYRDFAVWQQGYLASPAGQRSQAYWLDQLGGGLSLLDLPSDRPRPTVQDTTGSSVSFPLDSACRRRWSAHASKSGVTWHVWLLTVFTTLLAKMTGCQDIVVGAPVSGRTRPETEALIGYFVNTVAFRTPVDSSDTFRDLLSRVQKTTLEGLEHQDFPFEQLLGPLQVERNLSRNPLFDVMFIHQSLEASHMSIGDLTVSVLPTETKASKFDLTLHVVENAHDVELRWEYATALFEASTIVRTHRSFLTLADSLCARPDRPIREISLLDQQDEAFVLNTLGGQILERAGESLVHEFFERQVLRTPGALAVTFGVESCTYDELNRRANRLAHHLRKFGVRSDSLVALCAERTIGLVVAMLGVLKAGGAYVPLDPTYPPERLEYMVKDAEPVAILSLGHRATTVLAAIAPSVPVIDLDSDSFSEVETNPEPSPAGLTPGSLAYVIYTSGSTGQPKGVMIEHRNTANFIDWARSVFSPEDLAKTLFSTSINFDLAVYELFVPLAVGAEVVLVNNTVALTERVVDVTLLNTVPSSLKMLLDSASLPKSVRMVNLAGEPLRQELVERIFAETTVEVVRNLYGPTETTTYSTWISMSREDGFLPTIGRPVGNTTVYLLDDQGHPVPVGVVGELYIGGEGVARGYLNRPDLTESRFLDDPFRGESRGRMYRTGDLGRWTTEGNIVYLGRNDFQVKIRGFRIELGEIEKRIQELPSIREVVVVARDEGAEKRLVAYLTSDTQLVPEDLRSRLLTSLPEFMVPSAFVALDRFPLTLNGKLDRSRLPAPPVDSGSAEVYEEPQGEVERALAILWSQLLKRDSVGRGDHFFQIGGDSIKVISLVLAIKRQFGVPLSATAVFQYSILADLARHLETLLAPREDSEQQVAQGVSDQLSARLGSSVKVEVGMTRGQRRVTYRVEQASSHADLSRCSATILEGIPSEFWPHRVIGHTETASRDPAVGVNKVVKDGRTQIGHFRRRLFEGQRRVWHPMSGIQRAHLRVGERQVREVLEFDRVLEPEAFCRSVAQVVNSQGALRSRLHWGPLGWHEYAPCPDLSIPFLDLSSLPEHRARAALGQLTSSGLRGWPRFWGVIPTSLVAVRLDFRTMVLVVEIDHLLSDHYSFQLLRDEVWRAYRGKGPLEVAPTYRAFVEASRARALRWDLVHLEERLGLRPFFEAHRTLARSLQTRRTGTIAACVASYDLEGSQGSEAVWQRSFQTFTAFAQRILECRELPVHVVTMRRRIADEDYSRTFGEFLDLVPVLVRDPDSDLDGNRVRRLLDESTREGILFVDLAQRRPTRDTPIGTRDALQRLRLMFREVLVRFNFVGLIERGHLEEKARAFRDRQARGSVKKQGVAEADLNVEVFWDDQQIHFVVFSDLGLDPSDLRWSLDRAWSKVVQTPTLSHTQGASTP